MARWIRNVLTLCLLAIVALLVVDGDPRGALTGDLRTRSFAFQEFGDSLQNPSDRGLVYFTYGDFSALSADTLKVSAAPWVLMTAALTLDRADGNAGEVSLDMIPVIFRSFGFHSPKSFGNWPAHLPPPNMAFPVGQNVGLASRWLPPMAVTIGNMGCAACHSSVMYDASGRPDHSRVWLGAPNTSINLQAYGEAIYKSLLKYTREQQLDTLWAAVDRLYPELSLRERLTLSFVVLPAMRKRLAELEVSIDRLIPYRSSLAGATNGLDALRTGLGLMPDGELVKNSVFNSVPDLGSRLFRDSFLNTGAYVPPGRGDPAMVTSAEITQKHRRSLAGIAAYFTVPSMGVTPERAMTHIDDVEDITSWMANYRPQPFPGPLDKNLLARGRELYVQHCASCHGEYDASLESPELVSFPNWAGDIGTDKRRAELFTPQIADAINNSPYRRFIRARTSQTYTAPPLTGLWASAPYFHNASVPSLRAMLYPAERPGKFLVGGHALDLDTVGVAGGPDAAGVWRYPPGHVPWIEPVEVDTSAFGLANTGHEQQFEPLDDADKRALLEYLKAL